MARSSRHFAAAASVSLLAVFALLFLLSPALQVSAAVICSDNVIPTLGNDTSPGYVPSGPTLLAPGDGSSYTYVVSNATDNLEIWVQSAPGVGPNDTFSRRLGIALSDNNTLDYYSVTSNPACTGLYERFSLDTAPPTNIYVSDTNITLSNTATGTEPHCFFDHRLSIPWVNFTGDYSACGFSKSWDNSSSSGGSYLVYSGRVHVMWEDFGNLTAADPVRPNSTTWYDVSIKIQVEANSTTNATSSTEAPYALSSFAVTSLTYTKAADGTVKANIAYKIQTNFPYYVAYESSLPKDFLVSDSGNDIVYAGLRLGDTSYYPGASWSHVYSNNQDGQHLPDGTAACGLGEQCSLAGVLSYSWKPSPSVPSSCSISSSTSNYQFDFVLNCNSSYAGTTNGCGTRMRTALAIPQLGAFTFDGNINFCKSANTDFPITWSSVFDVAETSRSVGQTIVAAGSFTSSKALSAVAIKSYRVTRNDLSGFWEMWAPADASSTADGSDGQPSSGVGVKTNFAKSIGSSNGRKSWSISTSFTPNIQMLSTVQELATTSSRGDFLVTLPNDKGVTLGFRITIALRLYADASQTFLSRRRKQRRLIWVEVEREVTKLPASATEDVELSTKNTFLKVPDTVQVFKDGTVKVDNNSTPTGTGGAVSPGLIGGIIAIIAGIAAAVGCGVAVVLHHRRRAASSAATNTVVESPTEASSNKTRAPSPQEEVIAVYSDPAYDEWAKSMVTGEVVMAEKEPAHKHKHHHHHHEHKHASTRVEVV